MWRSCHAPTHVLHLKETHWINLDVADAGVEKAGVAVAVALVLQHNQRAFTLESVAIPDELLVLVGIHKTLLIIGLLEILESVLVLGLSILGGFIGLRSSSVWGEMSGMASSSCGELALPAISSLTSSSVTSMCTSFVSDSSPSGEPSARSVLTPDTSPCGEPSGASVFIGTSDVSTVESAVSPGGECADSAVTSEASIGVSFSGSRISSTCGLGSFSRNSLHSDVLIGPCVELLQFGFPLGLEVQVGTKI